MIRVHVDAPKETSVRVLRANPVHVDAGAVVQVPRNNPYGGAYVVTPTDAVQVLATADKDMAEDLTILPIPENYSDVTVPLAWMGPDAEYVRRVYDHTYTLNQTAFNGWTPSTSAKVIQATTTAGTFVADMAEQEYLLRWRVEIDVALKEGATKKVQIERYCASLWQSLHRRPYGFANIAAEAYTYNYCTNLSTGSSYLSYYNATGTRTWTTGISYGLYPALQAATFSSTASDTPTVSIKTPTLNARCSTTYFATARAAEVDQANTTLRIRGDLYRTRIGFSMLRNTYGDAIKVFNDGINAD